MWDKDLMKELGDKRALLETMCELLDIAHSVPDDIYNEVFFSSEDEDATDRIEWQIYMLKEKISILEQTKLEDYNSSNPIPGGPWTRA
jgi:hypothetical protein